jgi:hypothetical protein
MDKAGFTLRDYPVSEVSHRRLLCSVGCVGVAVVYGGCCCSGFTDDGRNLPETSFRAMAD